MCAMDASSAPIGKVIKRARERKRMSQAEAATALGVSRSALNAWENNRAYPRSSIGAIEELYGIVIDGDPEPQEPDLPTPEELDRLREHIREVLGERAPAVQDAVDRALAGEPPTAGGGAPAGGAAAAASASERRPRYGQPS
jgi:transcriptional regulator with XRE-family HTH domain